MPAGFCTSFFATSDIPLSFRRESHTSIEALEPAFNDLLSFFYFFHVFFSSKYNVFHIF